MYIHLSNQYRGVFLVCMYVIVGCNLGKYAENCSKNCNHCKNNASCGAATGKCNNEGCALSGFQVPFCQSEFNHWIIHLFNNSFVIINFLIFMYFKKEKNILFKKLVSSSA